MSEAEYENYKDKLKEVVEYLLKKGFKTRAEMIEMMEDDIIDIFKEIGHNY